MSGAAIEVVAAVAMVSADWAGESPAATQAPPTLPPSPEEETAQEEPVDELDLDQTMPGADPDLWLYRHRTTVLLRRYMRMSVEVGRLPSLLGREFFRARVTRYRAVTFEDAVIFVHDVERALERLAEFDKKLIAKIVLQDYTQDEAARLLGCQRRTVGRRFPEALDRLSEILLEGGILARLPVAEPEPQKSCQEGGSIENSLSDSEQRK